MPPARTHQTLNVAHINLGLDEPAPLHSFPSSHTVAASGAFPLPPLPGMFPGSSPAAVGGDATTESTSTSSAGSVAAKPPSQMSAAEYVAAANAPREGKVAAGVAGNAGTGFQWEDVMKAGREGKLDVNTNGDEVSGAPVAAPGGGAAADAAAPAATAADAAAPDAAAMDATPPVPVAAAVPAKRTPPSQLPAASAEANAAAKSQAAWAEVMAAGRAGKLDLDTTGAKGGAPASPAASP